MRALLQRVTEASVRVDDEIVGQIGAGVVVLLGVSSTDGEDQVDYMAHKIATLRLFNDEEGRMNRSLIDIGGAMLVVSQFTLLGDVRKGRRPSFVKAAGPDLARQLYEDFVGRVRSRAIPVETGRFQAHMHLSLTNDGPVTLWVDSDDVSTLQRGS